MSLNSWILTLALLGSVSPCVAKADIFSATKNFDKKLKSVVNAKIEPLSEINGEEPENIPEDNTPAEEEAIDSEDAENSAEDGIGEEETPSSVEETPIDSQTDEDAATDNESTAGEELTVEEAVVSEEIITEETPSEDIPVEEDIAPSPEAQATIASQLPAPGEKLYNAQGEEVGSFNTCYIPHASIPGAKKDIPEHTHSKGKHSKEKANKEKHPKEKAHKTKHKKKPSKKAHKKSDHHSKGKNASKHKTSAKSKDQKHTHK